MNPFVYPKDKHRRTERPGVFSDYRAYKPYLRLEFSRKCVYCLMPDTANGGAEHYGVDHYRPKSRFPDRATDYRNLYYCCNACNRRKGSYWPSAKALHVRFIPNPCDHVMANHLKFSREQVRGVTPAGKHTLALLDLNDPDSLKARALIVDAIVAFQRQRRERVEVRQALKRAQSRPGQDAKKETAIGKVDAGIARIDEHLARLTGTVIA